MNLTAQLIARRTKKGHNETQSRELLTTLLNNHTGDNLESALVYNDFATKTTATKFVASL